MPAIDSVLMRLGWGWGCCAEGSKEIQSMKIRWVVVHCLVLAAANCYQRFSVYFCGLAPDGCGRRAQKGKVVGVYNRLLLVPDEEPLNTWLKET